MKTTIIYAGFLFLIINLSGPLSGSDDGSLPLSLADRVAESGQLTVRRGDDGSLFVLNRSTSVLHRIDPATGKPLWQIDGSETGEAFIDPAWLSRPDGFFIFLTDRGARKVWRIDYRGELRGAVELSFAADPVLLEIAAGGQLVVHDRAAGLIYLLDDTGRRLWSFPPGEGRTSAEPLRMAVGPDGQQLFMLWRESPQLTVTSLSGQSTRRLDIDGGLTGEVAALAVAGGGDNSALALVTKDNKLFRLDIWSGVLEKIGLEDGYPLDVCGDSRGFTVLTGPEPALRRLELEGGR